MISKPMLRAGGLGPGASANLIAAGPSVLLADVSEFQPDITDAIYLAWSKAIAIRVLYGSQHDDGAWYGGQRRDLLHAGGARVVLIYQYLVGSQSGVAQAQAFRRLVGAIRPGEVFVADYEEGAKTVLTDWYNEMLALYGQGIHPHLWTYTGLNFGEAQGVLPVEWIAAYQPAEPATPHKLWQFTNGYRVPGVGTCDCSLYRGTIDELAALAYQEPARPPADWTYGPVQHLQVTPGHHDFRATWSPPAGAPEPPDHYLVYVYKSRTCDVHTLVPTYPRTEHGTSTSPDPGGLEPGTEYTLHVVAVGAGGGHVKPFEFAAAVFTTGRA